MHDQTLVFARLYRTDMALPCDRTASCASRRLDWVSLKSAATPIFPGRRGDREELIIVPIGEGRIKLE